MLNPTVSVVIPTYNRSELLQRAIESVLSQTYQNFELIVVDDNSQDNTHATVLGFKDHRVQYIKNDESQGPSAARNKGVLQARGEFVAFLDDDDVWMKDNLRKRVTAVKDFDGIICHSTVDGKRTSRPYNKSKVDLNDLRRGNIFTGGASVGMVRTSVLKASPF